MGAGRGALGRRGLSTGDPAAAPLPIRAATPDDAEGIERLRLRCWQAAYRGIVPDGFLDRMTAEVERRRRLMLTQQAPVLELVAVDGGAVAGWLVAGPSRDADTAGAFEVYACYVAVERWRSGIGGRLLGEALAAALARGHGTVTLWVLRDNAGARAFYERMGFAPDGASQELPLGAPVVEVRYRRTVP